MQEFRITYDGPALAESRMDVRELAPALLAVGDLLDSATRVLYGDKVRPVTTVNASFKTGCFGIDFGLDAGMIQSVIDIFSSREASSAANALAILGAVGVFGKAGYVGLLKTLKWIKGRALTKVDVGESKATLYIDADQLEVEIEVIKLLRSIEVRENVDRMLSPLDTEGIDTFAVGTIDDFDIVIHKDERAWFRAPAIDDELILEDQRKMVFSIISLAFKDDNKWRLYDGNATISALISDDDFLHRVNHNLVSFSKGDILICMVNVKQWHTVSGARTEYEVVKVIEHRSGAQQLTLPIE